MLISEVSKKTGLTQKAIRLYEAKGLIPPPTRKGRYRTYTQSDLDNLNLINEAKALGLTLKQLEGYVVDEDGRQKELDWAKVEELLANEKLKAEAEIVALKEKIKRIEVCIDEIIECAIEG